VYLPLPIEDDSAGRRTLDPSVWMRYVMNPSRYGRASGGRRVSVIPKHLARRMTQKALPGNVAALSTGLRPLRTEPVLDVLADDDDDDDDDDDEPAALTAALGSIAERVWTTDTSPGVRFARNGYPEPDMLALVLRARQWGPRVALWQLLPARR
jgi:hypothetical protein